MIQLVFTKSMAQCPVHLEDDKSRLADVIPSVIECICHWQNGVSAVLHHSEEYMEILNVILTNFYARKRKDISWEHQLQTYLQK